MSKTPASQLLASKRYYAENKDKINNKRKEYFLEYNKAKREEIRNDDGKRLSRNEYQRNYHMKKKADNINKMFIPQESIELHVLGLCCET